MFGNDASDRLTGAGNQQAALEDAPSATKMPVVVQRRRQAKAAPKPKPVASPSPSASPVRGSVGDGQLDCGGANGKSGRPAEDWSVSVFLEYDAFSASGLTDQSRWASEAPTELKDIEKKVRQMRVRIKNSKEMTEVIALRRLLKIMDAMSVVISVICESGLGSEEPKRVYDLQVSNAKLGS